MLEYNRKSRTDDPLLSVEEVLAKHKQMLDDWVSRNLDGPIPEENCFQEVVSGETIDSRPQVQELLRRVESPKIKAVLIKEPQRLSRGDLEDIGRLVKILRYTNTLVVTLDYIYDLRDPRDRDDFERELKRGNEFLEYQKKIMNAGRLLAVQNGYFIGNKAPYGYRRIEVKEGRRTCYTLEPVPEAAKIVKMIFEMYAQGTASKQIARNLNSMGIPSPLGGKWSAASMKKMRSNEHYIGYVVWGRRKTVKTIEGGELVAGRPISDDYLRFKGKHPAIIDQELWDQVQAIRGQVPPVKGKSRCVNPYAGILFCQCGKTMVMRRHPGKDGTDRCSPRLLCDDQPNCGTASCTVDDLTREIVRVLQAAVEDFQVRIEDDSSAHVETHRKLIRQLEQRLEQLNELEIAQWEKYTLEAMPKSVFDRLNEKLLREREEVQQTLCDAKNSVPEPADFVAKKTMFSDALEALTDPEAPALQKNLLLKKCIERIDYNRKKKDSKNPRWGDPEPMELDIHLRV